MGLLSVYRRQKTTFGILYLCFDVILAFLRDGLSFFLALFGLL